MQLDNEFSMSFDSKISEKGWTNFKIHRGNGPTFKASFSVTRQEFGRGKPFVTLPLEVQQKANLAALRILIDKGLLQ